MIYLFIFLVELKKKRKVNRAEEKVEIHLKIEYSDLMVLLLSLEFLEYLLQIEKGFSDFFKKMIKILFINK